MRKLHNPDLVPFSQQLRREMTKEERHLWYDFLSKLPCRFRRQKIIGRYIADFFCASANIVVELDGSQHYSEIGRARDEHRDAYFASHGIRVLRYSNLEIQTRFEDVCQDIWQHLIADQKGGPPLPAASRPPSPQ